jgi:hypothetical protein
MILGYRDDQTPSTMSPQVNRCPCGLWRLGQSCSCRSIDQVIACAATRQRTDTDWKIGEFNPTPEVM